MGIINKLTSALRGGLRESAEEMIDMNGLRIFAQEIHDCETNIKHSKQQLASIIAEKSGVKRELDQLLKRDQQREEKITQLLDENKEAEALKVAQLMAEQAPMLKRQQKHYQQLKDYTENLQQNLKRMATRLSDYRAEYQMIQATDTMQSAQTKLSTNSANTQSKFSDMQESLSRIQQRQQQFSDKMNAMDEVEAYLDDSGLEVDNTTSSAKEILEALRNNKKS